MNDTETITDKISEYRRYYSTHGYDNVERWVRKACVASKVPCSPPAILYRENPAEFEKFWMEE